MFEIWRLCNRQKGRRDYKGKRAKLMQLKNTGHIDPMNTPVTRRTVHRLIQYNNADDSNDAR